MYRLLKRAHRRFVYDRRMRALADVIGPLLLSGYVLDVGSGDGGLGKELMVRRPDVNVIDLDVSHHGKPRMFSLRGDGARLPLATGSVPTVLLIDVLHHTLDAAHILKECLRVGQRRIIIKDHGYQNIMQYHLLRLLDWAANRPLSVPLPYRYFTRETWNHLVKDLNAEQVFYQEVVPGMYPQPLQALMGRGIQFVAILEAHNSHEIIQ